MVAALCGEYYLHHVSELCAVIRALKAEGVTPQDIAIDKLVAGGESFADESRAYVEEVWDVPVYNTYGSTEGTMCGECHEKVGLHVPEDMVHLDLYDPARENFVDEGECGRIVLTSLLPPGGKTGTLLLNYDTEDTSVVVSRDKCPCGRTHMRILNPEREAETAWVMGAPFNRVDVEKGVFQRENMDYLTGEYEAFLYGDEEEVTLRVSVECQDTKNCAQELVKENLLKSFLQYKLPYLKHTRMVVLTSTLILLDREALNSIRSGVDLNVWLIVALSKSTEIGSAFTSGGTKQQHW